VAQRRLAGTMGHEDLDGQGDPVSGGHDGAEPLVALVGLDPSLPPITLQHVGWRWYQADIGRSCRGTRSGSWVG
jgi:hypothetical protein